MYPVAVAASIFCLGRAVDEVTFIRESIRASQGSHNGVHLPVSSLLHAGGCRTDCSEVLIKREASLICALTQLDRARTKRPPRVLPGRLATLRRERGRRAARFARIKVMLRFITGEVNTGGAASRPKQSHGQPGDSCFFIGAPCVITRGCSVVIGIAVL